MAEAARLGGYRGISTREARRIVIEIKANQFSSHRHTLYRHVNVSSSINIMVTLASHSSIAIFILATSGRE